MAHYARPQYTYAGYPYQQQQQPQQPQQQPYPQQYLHPQQQQHQQSQQQQYAQAYYLQQQQQRQQQQQYQQPPQQPPLAFPSAYAGSTPGPAAAQALRPLTPQPHRRHTYTASSAAAGTSHHRHRPSLDAPAAVPHSHHGHGTVPPTNASAAGQRMPVRSSLKRRPPVASNAGATVATSTFAPAPATLAPPQAQSVPFIQRARTYSGGTAPGDRARLSSARSRTNSVVAARELPTMLAHAFLSVKAPDLLELANVVHPDVLSRVEIVCRDWHRPVHFDRTEYALVAKFSGRPFSATGPDNLVVQRLLIKLFTLLGNEGYVSLTSVHNGSGFGAPRLVLIRSTPDPTCTFFAMSLHDWGASFVSAPRQLVENLALTLNGVFPKAFADHDEPDGVIAVRRRPGTSVDRDHFHAVLLRYFNDAYFKLDAALSLGRTGLFGLAGPRQELWFFKSSDFRPRASGGGGSEKR